MPTTIGTPQLCTLGSFRAAAWDAAGIDVHDQSDEAAAKRHACDLAVGYGLKFLAGLKPPAGCQAGYHRTRRHIVGNLRRAHSQAVADAQSGTCSVGVILSLILAEAISWIAGKVFDFLWAWWRGAPSAPSLICTLAFDVAGCDDAVAIADEGD